jgi:hypothetical protein
LTKEPRQLKLETLGALCTALDCTPNDLIEVDTTPVEIAPITTPRRRPKAEPPAKRRSLPPA